jgi:Fe-S cluster biogenesis protein NfuA
MDSVEMLADALGKLVVPLVTIDEGTVHIVSATTEHVHLHLGGAYAGCPGNEYVERSLLAPIVRDVFPNASLKVTSGLPLPREARAVESQRAKG